MVNTPDVILTYSSVIRPDELKELRDAFFRLTPKIITKEASQSIQNNIDWLLPAAVIIYVTQGFINGFLQEAGSDIYHSLKKALHIGKAKPIGWLTSSSLPNNREVQEKLSPLLSITFEMDKSDNKHHSVQFIFPSDVNLTDAEKAIDAFRETVLTIMAKDQALIRNEETPKHNSEGHTSYAFVPELSQWRKLTPNFLYEYNLRKRSRKKKTKRQEEKNRKKD
jgi:hypothetical protein